jgi:hypothetical protein
MMTPRMPHPIRVLTDNGIPDSPFVGRKRDVGLIPRIALAKKTIPPQIIRKNNA